jgi:S-adenosylmethionine:tRNA ribosyltransferase-isomerase
MVASAPESETVRELVWNVIIGSGRKCREGQIAVFGPSRELKARLLKPLEGIGMWKVEFVCERPLMELLDEFGHTPVPPYVKREGTREEEIADRERYQTIYAAVKGAVAAPTAGLHFTPEIFAKAKAKGVRIGELTLHVGAGTFKPVSSEYAETHQMHYEDFVLSEETARLVNETRKNGGRVLAVGTTTVRVLESCCDDDGVVTARSARTNIFLYPPRKPKGEDMLLTNFHLPCSTLLMLVSCFADREKILAAYEKAKAEKITQKIHDARAIPTKKTQRERVKKENPTKEMIISKLAEFLPEFSENVEIVNAGKLITFTLGENIFKLDLVQQRKKKS